MALKDKKSSSTPTIITHPIEQLGKFILLNNLLNLKKPQPQRKRITNPALHRLTRWQKDNNRHI